MASHRTHYDTLGVDQEVDPDELRRVWKILVQVWHPDRFEGDMREHAHAQTSRINEAYNVLRDADKRSAYDRTVITIAANATEQRRVVPRRSHSGAAPPRPQAGHQQVTARSAIAEFARAFEEAARCYPRVVGALSACLVLLAAIGVLHARSDTPVPSSSLKTPIVRAAANPSVITEDLTTIESESDSFPTVDADVAAAQQAGAAAPIGAADPEAAPNQPRSNDSLDQSRASDAPPHSVSPEMTRTPRRIIRVMPKRPR